MLRACSENDTKMKTKQYIKGRRKRGRPRKSWKEEIDKEVLMEKTRGEIDRSRKESVCF